MYLLQCLIIYAVIGVAGFFPCDHSLRHSPPQGRAAWKTRFLGQVEIEGVREQSCRQYQRKHQKFLAEHIRPYSGRYSPEADKVATAEMSAPERKADIGGLC